jgi:hypothetical protein
MLGSRELIKNGFDKAGITDALSMDYLIMMAESPISLRMIYDGLKLTILLF